MGDPPHAPGLVCVERLVNAKENVGATEPPLLLLFLGCRMEVQEEAGLQEQLGGKWCSLCTHRLKSAQPR